MKVGIYPGSFNPLHIGHMKIVDMSLEKLGLDKVIVVPLNSYWDKSITVSMEERIKMLKLIESDKVVVDDNCPDTYACDIINKVNKDYNNPDIYYIIGADSLESIERWKNIEEVLKYNFVVTTRSGFDVKQLIKDKGLDESKFTVIDFNMDVSSTVVRNKIKEGLNVDDLLDSRIYGYIIKNNLYKEN